MKIRVNVEARLRELVRRLKERGLKFPESKRAPGSPHLSEIIRLVSANESTFGLSRGTPTSSRLLLNQLVDEVGLMDLGEFRDAVRADPGIAVAREIPDETMASLDAWASAIRAAGLGVPESKISPGEPYFALIGRSAGADAVRLAHPNMPYRAVIAALVEEIGLMCPDAYSLAVGVRPPKRSSLTLQLKRAAQVQEFLVNTHVTPSVPVPESSHRRGRPHYGKICKNAGLSFRGSEPDAEIVKVIDEAAQLVGIGADRFRPVIDVNAMTYAQLLEHGVLRLELESPTVSKSKLERFKSALRKMQRAAGKRESDGLGRDFEQDYDRILGDVAGAFENEDTRRHFLGDMRRWYAYVATYKASSEQELPADFAGALMTLIRTRLHTSECRNLADLLRAAELYTSLSTVRGWLNGGREPVRSDRTLVHKLEDFFEVERETLAGRIRSAYHAAVGDVRVEFWPSSLNTEFLRKLAKPILPPEWAYLSESSREAIGASIRKEAQTTIEYRSKMRAIKPWRITPIPERVQEEWQELVDYKTALIPDLERSSSWSDGTVDRNWSEIHTFLSALALPREEGGLGVPPSQLTLALLANPKLVRWYINWQFERNGGKLNTGSRTWLGMFAHLCTLETSDKCHNKTDVKGFLHYVPHWSSRLQPIDGVLTTSDIAELQAPSGWEQGLVDTSVLARRVFKQQKPRLEHTRDPFQPILPILDLDRPLDALIQMLNSAYADLPDPRLSGEFRRAVALRRFVSALALVRTSLRRKNIVHLTVKSDNSGKLRRTLSGWRIEIPAKEFKNSESPFFGVGGSGNREKTSYIYDFDSADSKILDEYVNVSRPVLMRKSADPTDHLLISHRGNQMIADEVSEEFNLMTWTYLVYHEVTGTGIKGVEPFGPHAIRDIVATHFLKVTGDENLAADAIQDTAKTVREHYGRFLTSDRTKRVSNFLAQDLPPGAWGTSMAA